MSAVRLRRQPELDFEFDSAANFYQILLCLLVQVIIPAFPPQFRDVNTAIMELLVMAYALKTSCAKNIIGVIPYFPYSKQCKMRKRGSIVCKLLASMLAKAGRMPYTLYLACKT